MLNYLPQNNCIEYNPELLTFRIQSYPLEFTETNNWRIIAKNVNEIMAIDFLETIAIQPVPYSVPDLKIDWINYKNNQL